MSDFRPDDSPTGLERFRTLLRDGTRLLRQGRHNAALPLLEEAYDLFPDDPDAALNLGGAYILAGKFSRAIPVLEKLLEQEPENPMLWINLGAAYLGNPVLALDKHQRQAIAAFRRALELNPDAPSAAYNIGLIYRDRGELDHAVHWFQRAVGSNPDDGDAHALLARSAAERAAEEE
jgi:tetratricopeptide (TPR) repeat protein